MFRRQIKLIGEKNQEILKNKSILIVGCGGLGNSLGVILSCIGLKKIILIDFDEIEIHNLHRQFLFSKNDLKEKKAEVLANKIKRCDTKIEFINAKFNEDLEIKVDLVFDASDNFETRKKIDKFAKKNKIPWIYASVDEFIGQVGVFEKSSFDMFVTKEQPKKGQIPPMVSLIASIEAMLGIKKLIGKQEEILYFVDFNEELEIKKFKF